jgi:ribosomal protein S18 acetylase RimI-like enzyme
MAIRPATEADLPRVIELSLASFGPITWQRSVDRLFGPLKGRDWRERWKQRVEKAFREQIMLVLEEDGRVVGYACGTIDEPIGLGHIDILAVDPAARRKGHGRELLRAIEKHFSQHGATHVTLESLADNEAANALYRRTEYQDLARHINWFKKIE